MPTEAKQATVAELVAGVLGQPAPRSWPTTAASRVSDLGQDPRASCAARASATASSRTGWRKIAAEQAGRAEFAPLLTGPAAVALGGSDEAALAKGVLDALRPYRNVVIRGGAIGGTHHRPATR